MNQGTAWQRFFNTEAASGIALILAAAVAIGWANSPFSASYDALWHQGAVHFLINDALMAVFFLVVGLEIRHEMHDGALEMTSIPGDGTTVTESTVEEATALAGGQQANRSET